MSVLSVTSGVHKPVAAMVLKPLCRMQLPRNVLLLMLLYTWVPCAGIVGLAIARKLAMEGKSVVLLERNSQVGQETSARNSEGAPHIDAYIATNCRRSPCLLAPRYARVVHQPQLRAQTNCCHHASHLSRALVHGQARGQQTAQQ
jgi:FAD dependent oxidoreductase